MAGEKRTAARLSAIQALYGMDVAGSGVIEALEEYENHWMLGEADGLPLGKADIGYFRDLVSGVVKLQKTLDPAIDQALNEAWPLKRIDVVMRALLRVAAYELYKRKDVPVPVIINEAVDLAKGFFDETEKAAVHAVLDRLSKLWRAEQPLQAQK